MGEVRGEGPSAGGVRSSYITHQLQSKWQQAGRDVSVAMD